VYFFLLLHLVFYYINYFLFNDDGNRFNCIHVYYIFITIFVWIVFFFFYTTRFDSFETTRIRILWRLFLLSSASLSFIMCLYFSLSVHVFTFSQRVANVLATCFSLWLRICIVVMFLLLLNPFSRIFDRGLFLLYISVFNYLFLYHSCIFALLFLFLFRELFCKPHVKLIAPTAYVPFSVFVMTYYVYDMMRHRDVILHCRYSTVDNILRTVITSIFVGIYDCPVCLRHLFLSLHYIGGKNVVLFHAYSRLGSLNSNLACFWHSLTFSLCGLG